MRDQQCYIWVAKSECPCIHPHVHTHAPFLYLLLQTGRVSLLNLLLYLHGWMDSFVRWMPYTTYMLYYCRSYAHKKNVESNETCVIYFDAPSDICHAQTDQQCWSSFVCPDKRHESISKLLSNILISLSSLSFAPRSLSLLSLSLFLSTLSPYAVLPYFNELLSAEILVHIFSYLREGDLVRISMVCRKFHQIASMESLW